MSAARPKSLPTNTIYWFVDDSLLNVNGRSEDPWVDNHDVCSAATSCLEPWSSSHLIGQMMVFVGCLMQVVSLQLLVRRCLVLSLWWFWWLLYLMVSWWWLSALQSRACQIPLLSDSLLPMVTMRVPGIPAVVGQPDFMQDALTSVQFEIGNPCEIHQNTKKMSACPEC